MVKMMQRLMANIDLISQTRKTFQSREAFNVHPTTRHQEQNPFPDQIKAAHFILRKKFLNPSPGRRNVAKFGSEGNAYVSASNVDAYGSGKKKVLQNFERKLYSLYGIIKESAQGDDDDYESNSD